MAFSLSPRLSGERAGERGFPHSSTAVDGVLHRELKASSPWPSPPLGEERELIYASLRVPLSNASPDDVSRDVVMTRLSSHGTESDESLLRSGDWIAIQMISNLATGEPVYFKVTAR